MIIPLPSRTPATPASPLPKPGTPRSIRRGLSQLVSFASVGWVVGAMIYLHVNSAPTEMRSFGMWRGAPVKYSGWPLAAIEHRVSDLSRYIFPRSWVRRYDCSAICINVEVFLFMLAGTVYASVHLGPRLASRQFGISQVLRVMVVVAVMAILLPFELQELHRPRIFIYAAVDNYQLILPYPWWVYVPVLYGFACAIYLLTVFFTGAGGYLLRRTRRRTEQPI